MGLVNTVVPLEELEEETVRWCREMLALSPFALRLLKASFNAAEDGMAGAAAARPRRQPPVLRERRGAGGTRRLQGQAPARLREVPEAAVSARARRWGAAPALWLLAAAPTLPAAVAPVLVGTALAATEDVFRLLPFVAALVGCDLHPDRHEPVERLLGRPPRRRHRGPPRPGAGDGRRADAAQARAGRHLRRIRRSRSPAGSTWPPSPVGSCSWSEPRRSSPGVLYTGGPRPYGYEGLGELFVFVFFGVVAVVGLLLTCRRRSSAGRRSRSRRPWACSPRPSSWSTTCAT